MKCPHCGYLHGWDANTLKSKEGKMGPFYSLPIRLERIIYYSNEAVKLFGCPNCNKTFIEKVF